MAKSDASVPSEIAKLQEIARSNVAAAKSMREAVLRSMASPPAPHPAGVGWASEAPPIN